MSPSEWFGKNERFDRLHCFCKEHSLWDDYFPSNRIKELTSDFKDSQLMQRSFSSTQVKFGNFCSQVKELDWRIWKNPQEDLMKSTGGFGEIHVRILRHRRVE